MFMDIQGNFLKVRGKTTSPFHSTRREYASLVQTSTYILGSTLRGALLSGIIRQIDCPEWVRLKKANDSKTIGSIHRGCGVSCPVKSFFSPSQVILSFGKFDNMGEEKLQRTTRIAIEREGSSVSEGAIVNIEIVPPETPFTFEILLLGESLSYKEQIKKAVYNMAEGAGIGRYRSIGFGQFQITEIKECNLMQVIEEQLNEIKISGEEKGIKLILRTPLVLGDGQGIFFPLSNRKEFIKRFCEEVSQKIKRFAITGESLTDNNIQDVEMKIQPDYVHRFSYEIQNKENRLVACPDSEIKLHCKKMTPELYQQFVIIYLTGLGEWSDWGFGRFDIEKFNE